MHTPLSHSRRSQFSRWAGAITLTGSLLLAACGPSDIGASKLKPLHSGATRDQVLAAMGTGPLAPTKPADQPRIVNGFRRQMFITSGQAFEVFWYREEPGTVEDPILKERETPVLMVGDTLAGWGWKFYSPFAAKINLPDPTADQARLDSIYRSQNKGKP